MLSSVTTALRHGLVFALIADLAATITACSRISRPSVVPTSCDAVVKKDALAILGPQTSLHFWQRTPSQVDYTVTFAPGIAYLSYLTNNGTCRLAHLDARWQHLDKPMIFNLTSGNLKRVELRISIQRFPVVFVDDRWDRKLAAKLPEIPDGLTLWGDDGPLHLAVGGRWQTEAGPDIIVGKSGPTLYEASEGATYPPEWDAAANRFGSSAGVYAR
jgi:hypothetical protein